MQAPPRTLLRAAAALLMLLWPVADVHARGGRYRGPLDDIAPGRSVRDPVPPRPPPLPPGAEAPQPPAAPTPRRPRAVTFDDWTFWYHHNNADIEPIKRRIYTRVGSAPLFPLGREPVRNRSDATFGIRATVQQQIIPALLRVVANRKLPSEVRAAGTIALAKVTSDPTHIALLKQPLAAESPPAQVEAESLLLALGLLRRGHARQQFSAALLDDTRATLLGVFADKRREPRLRGFAALAIGLLGDQPSADAPAVVAKLFALLAQSRDAYDPSVGLLIAIGLQPRAAVTAAQREVLRRCLHKRHMDDVAVPEVICAYAAQALGRVGTAEDIPALQRALLGRRVPNHDIRRSATIALGHLAAFVDGKQRVALAKRVLTNHQRRELRDSAPFAVMALAEIAIADVEADSFEVLVRAKVGAYLARLADDGRYVQKPWAALALARVVRAVGEEPSVAKVAAFREHALGVLRAGLVSKKLGPFGRAGFAVALGMAEDYRSVKPLVSFVGDAETDPELRAYAALGLGLIGQATRDVLEPLRGVVSSAAPSGRLFAEASAALGLLSDYARQDLLEARLAQTKGADARAALVLAIARTGGVRAVKPLLALLEDPEQPDLIRAVACVGLGLVGDLEFSPSLARLSRGFNYRAHTPLTLEALSIR